MFANILRADLYRLLRSRFLHVMLVMFVVIMGLFLLMASSDGGIFGFGGPTGEVKDGVALADGYVGFQYADAAHPHFRELLASSMCFGIFAVFAVAITAAFMASSDDLTGVTRLAVARGQSRPVLFASKIVAMLAWTLPLWILHNVITMMIVLWTKEQSLTGAQWGDWASMVLIQYGLMLALMLLTALVQVITGSRIASVFVPLVTFAGAIIIQGLLGPDPDTLGQAVLQINPMFHLNRISRYWAHREILDQALIFMGASIPLLGAACALVLSRRETA